MRFADGLTVSGSCERVQILRVLARFVLLSCFRWLAVVARLLGAFLRVLERLQSLVLCLSVARAVIRSRLHCIIVLIQ